MIPAPLESAMKYVPVLAIVVVATVTALPQAQSDETAIRNIIQEESAAWNAGDAVAYSE
jgi:hypothetical protein